MSAEAGHIDWLGFVIFAIVIGSLLMIVLAAVLVRPKQPKVTMVVVGTLALLTVTLIFGMWIGGHIFSVLMG